VKVCEILDKNQVFEYTDYIVEVPKISAANRKKLIKLGSFMFKQGFQYFHGVFVKDPRDLYLPDKKDKDLVFSYTYEGGTNFGSFALSPADWPDEFTTDWLDEMFAKAKD
jgi:hypothetical protein